MKHFIKLAAATAALAMSTLASAGTIQIDYNAGNQTIASSGSASYTFNFNLDPYNYVAGKDSIDWAKLQLRLKDVGGSSHGAETFSFLLGADSSIVLGGGSDIGNGVTDPYKFDVVGASLQALSDTGTLKLTVKSLTGTSFQWVDASLEANHIKFVEDDNGQPGSVPEPLSVALMGLGLAGIAAARRKA